jgi:hypothetical protein
MQLGGAFVLAVVSAIIGASGPPTGPGQLPPGMTPAIAVVVGVTVFGLGLTLVRLWPRRPSLVADVVVDDDFAGRP